MTRKEQNKTLDDKIKANNAQYDLDRMNAEISAYSSGELPKYEYLTNKDLGYKPDAFEQVKFEYLPLGRVFTDGLDKSDRNEGLSKRLKSIEDRNNNQLLAIKNIPRPAKKVKIMAVLEGMMMMMMVMMMMMMMMMLMMNIKQFKIINKD